MKVYIFCGLLLILGVVFYILYNRNTCRVIRTLRTDDGIIEIVNEECQEGLPHTTTMNIIRMAESVWNSGRSKEILKHERVHLDQKRRPHEWEEFYRSAWNYELLTSPPPDLPSVDIRPNPDTVGKPWALWRGRYLFYPQYGPEHTLRKAPVRIWDMKEKQHTTLPPEWRSEFCHKGSCPHQYEHPHEMAAEYITNGSTSASAVKLFRWFK